MMGSAPTKFNSIESLRSKFIFSSVIGKGGFGRVSTAMHIESKEWCAIKEIDIHQIINHRNGVKMLQNELFAHKQVGKHQFIVNLKSAFHDQRFCYMSFDLCVGGDLRYHLHKGRVFNEELVAFILVCIGSALHHIHSKGIIHRDVKPENIIFDDYGFALLTDFGVAHVSPPESPEEYCYLSSGTRQYIAPEIFTKEHKHNYSSDFWSLGVVGYELIYSVRPFEKHCPLNFIQFVEFLYSQGQGETPLDPCYSHHKQQLSSFSSCRSLSECCVIQQKGVLRPAVYIPEISKTNGIVSRSCLRVLSGLLCVDPLHRYGHGERNYHLLTTDTWYSEHQMTWCEIEQGEIAPPLTLDLRDISQDICKKYLADTNDPQSHTTSPCQSSFASPTHLCPYHSSARSYQHISTDLKNSLDNFFYLSADYEKYDCRYQSISSSFSQDVRSVVAHSSSQTM